MQSCRASSVACFSPAGRFRFVGNFLQKVHHGTQALRAAAMDKADTLGRYREDEVIGFKTKLLDAPVNTSRSVVQYALYGGSDWVFHQPLRHPAQSRDAPSLTARQGAYDRYNVELFESAAAGRTAPKLRPSSPHHYSRLTFLYVTRTTGPCCAYAVHRKWHCHSCRPGTSNRSHRNRSRGDHSIPVAGTSYPCASLLRGENAELCPILDRPIEHRQLHSHYADRALTSHFGLQCWRVGCRLCHLRCWTCCCGWVTGPRSNSPVRSSISSAYWRRRSLSGPSRRVPAKRHPRAQTNATAPAC
jgi:hypothetical protein